MNARVKNAPAGAMKISAGLPMSVIPPVPSEDANTLPVPRSSLMKPITVRAHVNPAPIASPSTTEARGGFFEANASARARMMQLTTISGIKSPRDADIAGKNALRRSSTAVTKPEMTTMNAAIRTCGGIIFLRSDMKRFENVSTAMTATPMPRAFTTEVVTARVGHIPMS